MLGSLNPSLVINGMTDSYQPEKLCSIPLSIKHTRRTVMFPFCCNSDLPHGGIIMVGLLAGANLAETDYMNSN